MFEILPVQRAGQVCMFCHEESMKFCIPRGAVAVARAMWHGRQPYGTRPLQVQVEDVREKAKPPPFQIEDVD